MADYRELCERLRSLDKAALLDGGAIVGYVNRETSSRELEAAELIEVLRDQLDRTVQTNSRLEAENGRLKKKLSEALEDMTRIAGECAGDYPCTVCVWNPEDMGCSLDGSQFDDGGECHFEWYGGQG